jgi:hypothetical protein
MNHGNAIPANGTTFRLRRMRPRLDASDFSDSMLWSEMAIPQMVMAARSSTAKTIPAIAAARRLRQKGAVIAGERVVTSTPQGGLGQGHPASEHGDLPRHITHSA